MAGAQLWTRRRTLPKVSVGSSHGGGGADPAGEVRCAGMTDRPHPGPQGTPGSRWGGKGGSSEVGLWRRGEGHGVCLGFAQRMSAGYTQGPRGRLSGQRREGPGLWGAWRGARASGWFPGAGPGWDAGLSQGPGAWRTLEPGAHPARGVVYPAQRALSSGRGQVSMQSSPAGVAAIVG